MRVFGLVGVLTAAALAASCGSLALPDAELVTARPLTAQFGALVADGQVKIGVVFFVRNPTGSDLELDYCGIKLEREEGAAWQDVWSPSCSSPLIRKFPPHSAGPVSFGIFSALTTPGKGWAAPVDGDYRVLLPMRDTERPNDSAVISAEFALVTDSPDGG